jgi:hypothetical protein
VSSTAKEPVLTRAAVVTVISILSALLIKTGGGDVSAWLDQNGDLIAGAVLAVAPLISGLLARRHVVPVAPVVAPQALAERLSALPAPIPPASVKTGSDE